MIGFWYYMEVNDRMGTQIVKVILKIFPLLFLFGSFWLIGFIPITYIYYPNLAVYRESITLFGIIAFVLTFLVIAVGVFNIRSIKQLGVIFLSYQPIKLIVDLSGTLYESKYLNNYIFYSVNFLTLFICLGMAVVIIKNKENNLKLYTNIPVFLLHSIPIVLINIIVPILENLGAFAILNYSLPYGAEEIFDIIIVIMSVICALLTIILGIFMQIKNVTIECDCKLLSVKALQPLILSMLFSITIAVVWRIIK